jgi:hypothetical protein
MKALIGIRIRRLTLLILSTISIVFFLTIESPTTALGKVRPPVEMGDPDDTGNQGSVPGPTSQPKLFSSPVVFKSQTFSGSWRGERISIVWHIVSGPLAFWLRSI